MLRRTTILRSAAALALGFLLVQAEADEAGDARMQHWMAHPQRTAFAVRTEAPPRLDGLVDDEVWTRAPLNEGFTQSDPDNGEPASLRTTFQVAYDDDALYIAAVCYDDPDSVTAALARRDESRERDFVEINLDPHHDHQTGVWFNVGPSGWIGDGIIYNDDDFDDGWDSVAEAAAAMRPDGWSVELKIPYHALRFGDNETWGINVYRKISRRAEWAGWSFTPRGVTGFASRFGHLEGIEGIEPRRSLEILPFSVGRSILPVGDRGGEHDLASSAGLDLRYGLSSNISLNATVNPDFGQVEGDPAVLNLTVFETFYRERRPFFLEGIQIFQSPRPGIAGISGPARLFHSRRIGRPPSRFPLPAGSRELERPDHTTILGAVKLSGKTGARTAFGLLNAVTGREEALVEQADPARGRVEVEPVTNYFVGRVQQDLLTNSTAGAEVTAVNGRGFDPAYVGAGDLHLKWRDNAYRFYTRLAVSRARQGEDRGTGWEGLLNLGKSGGAFGGEVHLDARSPAFQVNDLGYMKPRNRIQTGLALHHQKLHPYWLARRSGYDLDFWVRWNYDRVRLFRGVAFSTWHHLHDYWGFWAQVLHNLEGLDEVVTRGGPIMVAPSDTRIGLNVWTDARKPVTGRFGWNFFESRSGDNLRSGFWAGLEFRPMSQLRVTMGPSYSFQRNFAQWLRNEDDDGDGEADRFIFGELESRVLAISVRGDWTFTPTLSLQLYAQPFVTTGDYGDIKELARPRSYEFFPYSGFDGNPDFHFRSLHSNLVLRWEFRPGSTLFLVWQQSRGRGFDALDPRFRPASDLGDTFLDPGQSILLVKGNWWLGL